MYTTSKSFFDLKAEQLNQLSTLKLIGTSIEFPENSQANKTRGLFPIEVGCNCVQDSPENPCPCKDIPPIIVWLPKGKILKNYKSDKGNHDGRELTVFEIEKDATVFVERLQPINLSRISGIGNGHPINTNINTAFNWGLVGPFIGGAIAAPLAVLAWEVATGAPSDWLAGVDNSPHTVTVP
jgi:hypothetical protein